MQESVALMLAYEIEFQFLCDLDQILQIQSHIGSISCHYKLSVAYGTDSQAHKFTHIHPYVHAQAHIHTDFPDKSNFKKSDEHRPHQFHYNFSPLNFKQ